MAGKGKEAEAEGKEVGEKTAKPAEKHTVQAKGAKAPDDEKKELVETLQRLQAEFENYKKRAAREFEMRAAFADAAAIARFLPLADAMDSAMKNSSREGKKAIELIRNQFMAVLKGLGVEEMHCLGKRFDTAMHDCIVQGCDPKKDDAIVIEEIQKGYLIKGNVLRHAKVKVNKK